MSPGVFDLRVLGSTRLFHSDGSSEVALPPQRLRVLAALAFLGQVGGSFERVAELANTTPGSLQNAVSEIRGVTVRQLVLEDSGRYRLGQTVKVDRHELGQIAREAESLVDQDEDAAQRLAAQTLRLGQGEAWLALDHADVLVDRIAVSEERRSILLSCSKALLARKPSSALRLMAGMVETNPLDQASRLVKATALSHLGREAECLNEIDSAQTELVNVGLELGSELTALQQRVLLATPPWGSSQGHNDSVMVRRFAAERLSTGPFSGRADELDSLRALLAKSRSQGFSACLLEGIGGIGKTWLTLRWLTESPDVDWLYAACRPKSSSHDALLEAISHVEHPAATRFSRNNGRLELPPEEAIRQASVGRERLSHEFASTLSELAPLVLVVDDVQYADEATLSTLIHLVDVARPAGVLLVVIHRPGEISRTDVERLRELIGRSYTAMPLGPLSSDDLATLLSESGLSAADSDVRVLGAASGGVPLIAGLLVHSPEILVAIAERCIPPLSDEIMTIVRSQLAQLGESPVDLLRWLAISEGPTSLGLIAEAAGLGELETLGHLERAQARGLVVEADEGKFDLSHETLRTGILKDISRSRERIMHARIRDELLAGDPKPWAEIAFHSLRAGGNDEARGLAINAAYMAAREALDRFAAGDALDAIEPVLPDVHNAAVDPILRINLLNTGALAAGIVLDGTKRQTLVDQAMALARNHGRPEQFTQSALLSSLHWEQGNFDHKSEQALLEALDLIDGEQHLSLQAQILANLAGTHAVSGRASGGSRIAKAQAYANKAVALAEQAGDESSLVAAYRAKIVVLWATSSYEEQIELANKIAAVRDGQYETKMTALRWTIIVRLCQGRWDEAKRDLRQLVEMETQSAADPFIRGYTEQWTAMFAVLDANWLEAESLATAILQAYGDYPNLENGALTLLGWIGLETGNADVFAAIAASADDAARGTDGLPALKVFAALAYAHAGDSNAAHSRLEEVLGTELSIDAIPRDITWTAAIAAIAEIAALTDDRDLGARFKDSLVPWHGTIIIAAGGLCSFGAAERSTALFCLAAGEEEAARDHMRAAADLEAQLSAPAIENRRLAWQTRLGQIDAEYARRHATSSDQLGLLHLIVE